MVVINYFIDAPAINKVIELLPEMPYSLGQFYCLQTYSLIGIKRQLTNYSSLGKSHFGKIFDTLLQNRYHGKTSSPNMPLAALLEPLKPACPEKGI